MISAEQWKRLEPLLDAALELPPEDRLPWLRHACAGDATLLADAEVMLTQMAIPDSVLDSGVHSHVTQLLHEEETRFLAMPGDLGQRYRIERELGHGGMAIVYLATDRETDRTVAVKALRPEVLLQRGRERFEAEVRHTRTLRHPNIVPVLDAGSSDGWMYLVMPYIDGETLRARLKRTGRASPSETVRVMRDVLAALQHAHDAGIVHRDVKPSNVMLDGDRTLLTDFGIARTMTGTELRLTDDGQTVGTPTYMSPEQSAADADVGPPSDIYSAGVVCYEMLVRQPPLRAASRLMLHAAGADEWRQDRSALSRTAPAAIPVLERAMAMLPEERYPSAAAFAAALETLTAPDARTD